MIIQYIRFFLQFTALLLPLSMVCVTASGLPAGETIDQWVWLGKVLPISVICMIVVCLIQLFERSSWKEILQFSNFTVCLSWSLILMGVIEAVWGLHQLYGFSTSGHFHYALTGSFFNPGPYAGYLAMVLPICLHHFLQIPEEGQQIYKSLKTERVVAGVAGILILCVLPATMSRSAWMAAAIGCAYVVYMNRDKRKWRILWQKYKKQYIYRIIGTFFVLLIISAGAFLLKPDSALGRLFMWKIALRAIVAHPEGYPQGFAYAYNEAQDSYFRGGDYTDWEERVAGSPEYAFNEYLELGIVEGALMLAIVLLVIALNWWMGQRLKRYGVCGAILSVFVFAFSSYPMHVPAFFIALLFLLLACRAGNFIAKPLFLLVCIFIVGGGFIKEWKQKENACREWTNARLLYQAGNFAIAVESYEELYPYIQGDGVFLFEYGHSLHKAKLYNESNKILKEASVYSTDPMILNIIGKNYQALHCYVQAENFYRQAINRLPSRIYPYYLLAKLYADPEFRNLEKFEEMQHTVLTKEPKVPSIAVEEMRREVEEITKNWNNLKPIK